MTDHRLVNFLTYQGAKNFTNAIFPFSSVAKFSSVRLITFAAFDGAKTIIMEDITGRSFIFTATQNSLCFFL